MIQRLRDQLWPMCWLGLLLGLGGWVSAADPIFTGTAPLSVSSVADSDRDGYPDAAELVGQDRERFADWFASIAQSQYYGMNKDWLPADRDCGGLLRYAFINALMPHNAAWRSKFKFLPRPQSGDVQAFGYPLPIISRSVFRTAGGAYQVGDIEAGKLVGRTGVQYLANYSMVRVSREMAAAKRGDLLIFIRPDLRSYHSMVYLGGGNVVYHTGASPAEGGEVRLLTVQSLLRYAERAFHPASSNPNFLGVYRWKILN
ncbi:DUF1175 family protein [Deinococcus detaillensis]|uniref:DUF1175 family protein n=1 Tax=Deinococcus detaillensis TaxID=2592048 RepID=A0A553V524_9DEIO|nr:DUF1175 family protein [Deinococcus detaillensis]TSA87567.1 DUF1175 family protein [Deinococcus detaillensis]